MSSSAIARSYGHCTFFKETATLFHSGSTILHPHQQHMSDPASPNPGQHLVLSLFFISAVLVGMQRHSMIFICINIMATNIFICFISLCEISFVFCQFSNWIFFLTVILKVIYSKY